MKTLRILLWIFIFAIVAISINAQTSAYQLDNGLVKTGNETHTGATPLANYTGTCEAIGGFLSCSDVGEQRSVYNYKLINISTNSRNFTLYDGLFCVGGSTADNVLLMGIQSSLVDAFTGVTVFYVRS